MMAPLFFPSLCLVKMHCHARRIHNPEQEDDYQVSEGFGDESEQPPEPPSFEDLELKIKDSIQVLGGVAFPKLNWSAPKDSAWIGTTGTLQCTSFREISLLLRSSESLVHDLCHAFDSCVDKSSSRPSKFFLALRKCFESDNYTFDVYVTRDGRVKLIDFNPWGAFTLPLMFTWEELEDFERGENTMTFRIVDRQHAVRPGIKTAVPYDYLDTSLGSGWDEVLRKADRELQRQSQYSEAGA
ncbi:hypothetical protein Syun_025178 [Stephania yunnanensis]|uniref:Cell division cycle protein 123 homolog n=1 Tax=Stephania yunnanensis TaxID=152371 RepID=A0AAP0EWQ7_9MAGN